jgi:DNA-binding helix-turn-helix protein|nr:MAG TPA: helix-turn-helix domain protein [Caudoviricetes sp.]
MDYKIMIKALRNKMLLTQSEFAKMLGVSLASVARWELGENEPTMKVKRKLKELFIKYKMVEE